MGQTCSLPCKSDQQNHDINNKLESILKIQQQMQAGDGNGDIDLIRHNAKEIQQKAWFFLEDNEIPIN